MHNYLPLSTLSWIIAILIAFYGSHVNDVTRLPASNKSQTTRRDVVKFSPCPYPDKDITICFANERPISLIRTVAHRSAVNLVPIPSFTACKTDIPKLFMVDTFEGWTERRGEGKDWIDTSAREFLRREPRTPTESPSRQTHSTSRKRRGKVYANLVARVSDLRNP